MSVRELRLKTKCVRDSVRANDEVILTANGRPFAVVTGIQPERLDRELAAIRQARARMALDAIRESARETGTSGMTMTQVDSVIRKVRQGRNHP